MSVHVAQKIDVISKTSTEADRLFQLKQEAARILRLLDEGDITSDEAVRQLNALAQSESSFFDRVFRL